jgi:VanZ family protein
MAFFIAIGRAAGFCGIIGIIVLSLLPGTYRPHTGLPGEAEHFIAYCLTAFALALGFRPLAYRVGLAIGLSLLAGSMEVLQHFVPGRHPAATDAIVSGLGGLLGLALGGLLLELATQVYKKRRQLGESPRPMQ